MSVPKHLKGNIANLFRQGAEIYSREAHCGTCHQPNGAGLPAAGFPPLAGSEWVLKDEERLIKLTLKGLIDRSRSKGQVPWPSSNDALRDLLKDRNRCRTHISRNSFGNKASPYHGEQVAEVRAAEKAKTGLYNVEDLLKEHPFLIKIRLIGYWLLLKKSTVAQPCRIFWRTKLVLSYITTSGKGKSLLKAGSLNKTKKSLSYLRDNITTCITRTPTTC